MFVDTFDNGKRLELEHSPTELLLTVVCPFWPGLYDATIGNFALEHFFELYVYALCFTGLCDSS